MLKIYLTDLAAYNNGHLIGEWITLPIEEEKLDSYLEKILKHGKETCQSLSEHDEYFITDYEWEDVSLFSIGEYESIYELNEKLELIESFEENQLKIISFLLDEGIVDDIDSAIEKIDNVLVYEDSKMEDIAYDYIAECFDIDSLPSLVTCHIDYHGIGEEMKNNGNYFEVGGDIYEYAT